MSNPTSAAVPGAPQIKVSLDRSSIDFGEVEVGGIANDAFGVTNNSQCPLTLEVRGSGSRAMSVVCSGLRSGGEIGAGAHVGCQVVYAPRERRAHSRRVELIFGYGYACRRDLHKEMDVELEPRRQKLVDERDDLQSHGPDITAVDKRLTEMRTRAANEIEASEARNLELRQDSPEIVEAITKQRQLQAKVFERVDRLQRKWNELQATGPSTEAMKKVQEVRTAKLELDKARMQNGREGKVAEASRLRGERDQALDELRNGRFCAACGDSESEYHRKGRHLTEKSFEEHIAEHGERSATPEQIAKKEQEYADKILRIMEDIRALDDEIARVIAAHEKAATELAARAELLQKRHIERLDAIDAKIKEVRRTMSEQIATMTRRITELRDEADRERERNNTKIKQLQRDLVTAKASHAQAVADIEREHEATLERLDRELDELDAQHRVDERALDRKLQATESTHVTVSGLGVAR